MKAKTNVKAEVCPTTNDTSACSKKTAAMTGRLLIEPLGRVFIVGAALVVLPLMCFAGVLSGRWLPESAGAANSLTLRSNLSSSYASRIFDEAVNQDGNKEDDKGNPDVFPARSKPYGLSYGEWSARWWQWILSIPTKMNPNLDPTGVHCGEGQSGQVWFLPGSFSGPEPTRTCTVPTETSLFLPLPNAVYGAGVGDCKSPGWGNKGPCDVPGLRAAAAAQVDTATEIEVSLDGIPVLSPKNYRFQSPEFSYTLTSGNVVAFLFGFPVPAGTYAPAVSDGYWLMFKPLTPGRHTIHSRVGYGGFSGEADLHLIVQPRKHD